VKTHYLYAQIYEAQELYQEAINNLNDIKNIPPDNITSEESLYSKAYLNMGRLYYKQGELTLAEKNLGDFFREAKKQESKELLDLARVNRGMISGTMNMKDFIKLTKNSNFQEYLKLKLKYFADT